MKQQKMILVSMDAMIFEDLVYLRTYPTFSWLLERCALVERVKSIYPTLTYPCHATMSTGTFPSKHGVTSNYHFDPGNPKPLWVWYHDAYKRADLADLCKAAGMTTAMVGWPSSGKHPNVDYLVDELACTTAETLEDFHKDYTDTGTSEALWQEALVPHMELRYGDEDPGHCTFNTRVCCDIIRNHKPDLMMLHVANIDSCRHKSGLFSPLVFRALEASDGLLRELLQAIWDSGEFENTNLIVTADHGHMGVKQIVHPNVLLAELGYLDVDETGTVTNWRAWSLNAGMSTTIYIKDPADIAPLYALLQEKAQEGTWGFSKVYTQEETAEMGYAGDFSLMLETDDLTEFGDNVTGPYCVPYGNPKSSHGALPAKTPCPPLMAFGPAFRPGVTVKRAHLVDLAPTAAAVLGVTLPDADGTAIKQILK